MMIFKDAFNRIFQGRMFIRRASLVLWAIFFVLMMPSKTVLAGMDQYPGVVVKVDTGNSYLVVMNPKTGGRLRFSLTEKTDVLENEDLKDITDLAPGTLVIVDYEQRGEQYIARLIRIQPTSQ